MSEEKWYLGRVSRQKAEELLTIAGINGSFVIRSSESIPGAYALSVLYNKTVHTYRVLPTDNGMLAVQTQKGVQQRKFAVLGDLVREYRNPQNGLICALINPVGPDIALTPKPFEPPPALRNEALPPPPITRGPPSSSRLPHTVTGIKVMPQVETLPNMSVEKPRETRDLPPVPTRDAPPRQSTTARLATTNTPKPTTSTTTTTTDPSQKDAAVKTKLLSRLGDIQVAWPNIDLSFLEIVKQYTTEGGLDTDVSSLRRGGGQCAQLQTLLAREAVAFQSELEHFLMKIDVLRQLFDVGSKPRNSRAYHRTQDADVDLDTFLGRLKDCQTVVKSLNMRACVNLQELLGLSGASTSRNGTKKRSRTIEHITERTFEVKQDSALKYTRHKLKVDINKGKLSIIKGDGVIDYDHGKVLQLIKSNKSKSKLSIVLEGAKKRDYTFEQSAHREAFCQLMQYVRNKHSTSTEPDCVSIFCGSWNMGDAIPPSDISSWFLCSGSGRCLDRGIQTVPHDIYVVGTQETGLPEKDWLHKVIDAIQEITGVPYHVVAMDALWHIKILIVVKEEHKNRISHVETSSVKTGIANTLGNKGAVGVSFQFGGTSFCFINAHLTSGAEKCLRRNQNYHDIVRSLNLGEDRFRLFDLTNRFDHLYFLGDLNYRLEMDVQEILQHIKKKEMGILSKVDQLRREKDFNKVFSGFNEDEIQFPPTYRYERGTRDTYSHLKVKKTGVRINVPSWCDRVLWRSYPETHNVCHAYGCTDDIMTSDHSPLFSNFSVGVRGQYVSKEGSVKSNKNNKAVTSDVGYNCIRITWNADNLPKLKPIISDREYLVDQHILVSVRAEDDNEVQGECVIALRSMIGTSPQTFEDRLTRRGEDTGQMRVQMLVKARESEAPKEKTYDFIRRDDEVMKRAHLIEEVTYSDMNEVSQAAVATSSKPVQHARPMAISPNRPAPSPPIGKTFTPEVAVYGGANSPNVAEDEYADPDEVKSITTVKPGVQNVLAASSSGQNLSPRSSMLPESSHDSTEKASKPSSHSRPLPTPRTSPATSLANTPPTPMVSGSPLKAPHLLPPSAWMLDDALKEFAEAETMFNPRTCSPPITPVYPHLVTPSSNLRYDDQDMLYDTPIPIHERPASNTSVGAPSTTTAGASSKFPAHPARATPSTVDGFLTSINLMQYSLSLHDNGWDSIEFLSDITEEDLMESGVADPDHCRIILEKIQSLCL